MNIVMTRRKKFLRNLLTALLACGLLAGCTASFTYNHLDWLIPWMVEDYVDLTRDQKKTLKAQLEPFLVWHRREELQRYIEILDEIDTDVDSTLTGPQVHGWIDDVVLAAERTEYSMLQLALEFGDELSQEQMQEFIDSLWERQREYEEEYLDRSDQEYVEDNAGELADFMKKLIGRLTPEQKDRFEQTAGQLCRFDQPWLTDSEEWMNELEYILQRAPGWQEQAELAFQSRKSNRSEAFRNCADQNYAVISAGAADVLNMASDKQKTRLHSEIGDLRMRLQRLSEQKAD